MTRVSDTAAFAEAVAEGGALPFLALALLRGPRGPRACWPRRRDRLAGRPWGVGILGFVPPELRREQIEAIREARPPFALIAGGRPDQAAELERGGDRDLPARPVAGPARRSTSRTAPGGSSSKGRECGGHVGPRSSLVLWEQAVEVARSRRSTRGVAAGGDPRPLRRRHPRRAARRRSSRRWPRRWRRGGEGRRPGRHGLPVHRRRPSPPARSSPRFQAEAIRCGRTVLLETGPGHEVRVGPSPFADAFEARAAPAARPRAAGRRGPRGAGAAERRPAPRRRQGGRPRRGAGLAAGRPSPRPISSSGASTCSARSPTLRDRVDDDRRPAPRDRRGRRASLERPTEAVEAEAAPTPSDVAIVGMSAILPGAADVRTFWENTLQGRRRDHRGPRRPLGLAALLRRRPEGPRQDHLEVGRVRPRRPVRPAPLRDAADEPAVDRAGAAARSSKPSAPRSTTPATPTGRSPASGRPSSWAWAAGRRSWRWATPSARTCRCSTPSLPAPGREALEACEGAPARVDRGLVPRLPAERRRRAGGQPVRPRRGELHGRRRLRVVAGGGGAGGPRAGDRARPTW